MAADLFLPPGRRLITDSITPPRTAWPRVVVLGLVVTGLYDLFYLAVWLVHARTPRFGDFFGLWSFGAFVAQRPVAGIYDPLALQQFQKALDPAFSAAYPYLYPPSFLLPAIGLAVLPIGWSWCCWSAGSLTLSVAATLGRCWRSAAGLALLVAPTTLLSLIAGQSGLLAAALLIGGLRLLPAQPWIGGALLGLLTIKPQLGVLVPVALIAARQGRAIVAACVAALCLVAATGLCLGWDIWLVWLRDIPATAALILRNRGAVAQLMPTVSAGLFQLGLPDMPARVVQLLTAVAAAVATWRAARRGIDATAIAVLAMGTFLVTPYAYIYDLPMVTAALVLVLATGADRRLVLLSAVILVVPFLMLGTALPLLEPMLFGAGIVGLLRLCSPPKP